VSHLVCVLRVFSDFVFFTFLHCASFSLFYFYVPPNLAGSGRSPWQAIHVLAFKLY